MANLDRPDWDSSSDRRGLGSALIAVLAIALVVGSAILFHHLGIWQKIASGLALSPEAPVKELTLSALVACTGIDARGEPVGASGTFDEEQARSAGITLHIRYSDAVPGKSSFQFRWNAGAQPFLSPSYPFEKASDYLALNLGKGFGVGSYRVEFLVDGQPRQSAAFVVAPAPRPRAARRPDQKQAGVPGVARGDTSPGKPAPPAADGTAAQPSPPRPALPDPAPPQPTRQGWLVEVAPQALQYEVKHWHRIGRCLGQLVLTPRRIEFSSDEHAFAYDIKEVRVDQDGIADASGKAWRFAIPDADVAVVLRKWKRGELFPESGTAEQEAIPSDSAGSQKRSFAARHKHRLGSCSGMIVLTPESIEFVSVEHSFKCDVKQVRVGNEGVQDCTGKSWRFEVSGDDISVVLYLWKAGKLFSQ